MRRVNDIVDVLGDMVKFSQPLLEITFPHYKTVCPHVRPNYLGHGIDVIAPTVGVFQRLGGGFRYFCRILRLRPVSHYLVCEVGNEMYFREVVMCSHCQEVVDQFLDF